MNSPLTTFDILRQLVAEETGITVTKIRRDDALEDLGCDALDCINLQLEIEKTFGIDFALNVFEDRATVGAIALHIEQTLRGSEAGA